MLTKKNKKKINSYQLKKYCSMQSNKKQITIISYKHVSLQKNNSQN
jgi:hypothetical protein